MSNRTTTQEEAYTLSMSESYKRLNVWINHNRKMLNSRPLLMVHYKNMLKAMEWYLESEDNNNKTTAKGGCNKWAKECDTE